MAALGSKAKDSGMCFLARELRKSPTELSTVSYVVGSDTKLLAGDLLVTQGCWQMQATLKPL